MATGTNSKRVELDARRERVAQAYLRGSTQSQIAVDESVDQATISRDLKALQKAWQQSALVDIDEAKSRELARIDELERTYWTEWEASKEERETTTTKAVQGAVGGDKLPKRQEATIRKEKRLGDPAYLKGVQWCIEKRSAIMGFDAPTKLGGLGKDGAIKQEMTIDFSSLDTAALIALFGSLKE